MEALVHVTQPADDKPGNLLRVCLTQNTTSCCSNALSLLPAISLLLRVLECRCLSPCTSLGPTRPTPAARLSCSSCQPPPIPSVPPPAPLRLPWPLFPPSSTTLCRAPTDPSFTPDRGTCPSPGSTVPSLVILPSLPAEPGPPRPPKPSPLLWSVPPPWPPLAWSGQAGPILSSLEVCPVGKIGKPALGLWGQKTRNLLPIVSGGRTSVLESHQDTHRHPGKEVPQGFRNIRDQRPQYHSALAVGLFPECQLSALSKDLLGVYKSINKYAALLCARAVPEARDTTVHKAPSFSREVGKAWHGNAIPQCPVVSAGLFPGPSEIPKSTDTQVSNVKRCAVYTRSHTHTPIAYILLYTSPFFVCCLFGARD